MEAALKLARLATHKPGVVSAKNAFHGKTLGSLSSTHRDHFQQPFRPLMQHFTEVSFGDIAALEQVLAARSVLSCLSPSRARAASTWLRRGTCAPSAN